MDRIRISRRSFTTTAAGIALAIPATGMAQDSETRPQDKKQDKQDTSRGPREAEFTRDYDPPSFKPSWKNEQINRTMAQDFVIFAHSDLDKVKMLLEREPGLLNATMDWGAGDWESALGGASHMGRVDIVKFLLSKGARIDIFCAAMMGMLGTVKEMLALEPALIDAKGPHGAFHLHFHAQLGKELGHKNGAELLDHLQSIKEKKLRPIPFLKKKK